MAKLLLIAFYCDYSLLDISQTCGKILQQQRCLAMYYGYLIQQFILQILYAARLKY